MILGPKKLNETDNRRRTDLDILQEIKDDIVKVTEQQKA